MAARRYADAAGAVPLDGDRRRIRYGAPITGHGYGVPCPRPRRDDVPENPLKAAVEKLTEPFRENGPAEGVPGAPAPEAVPVEEPTEPRGPLPPKPDQSGPETVSPPASRPVRSRRGSRRAARI